VVEAYAQIGDWIQIRYEQEDSVWVKFQVDPMPLTTEATAVPSKDGQKMSDKAKAKEENAYGDDYLTYEVDGKRYKVLQQPVLFQQLEMHVPSPAGLTPMQRGWTCVGGKGSGAGKRALVLRDGLRPLLDDGSSGVVLLVRPQPGEPRSGVSKDEAGFKNVSTRLQAQPIKPVRRPEE
jgi:hypothetical protein